MDESDAAAQFIKLMQQTHTNFWFEKFGFIINPWYPYFGASPDGFVGCDCCTTSIVEIKCPFCARFSGVKEQMGNKNFYLSAASGEIKLDENHAYYYQVQMQLALSAQERCFFVVWSPTEALGKYFTKKKQYRSVGQWWK